MQSFTPAPCSALPVFTGINAEAVIELTDSRGGTTRNYEVAKLADNKCWMLNNLKLGSISCTITLTSADSNVSSNFTLPQLITSGTASYDNPQAIGPVPGDTGSGTTNYSYLYNWPAATAGESRTIHPHTAGNALYSICPANWRLPTGGAVSSDFGQLDVAFGGTAAYAGSGQANIAKWHPSGPFRGSFSGTWFGSIGNQGDAGLLWSASAIPGNSDYSVYVAFDPSFVSPGDDYYNRRGGIGVRCLKN